MPDLVIAVIASLFRALRSRRDLVLENLALRHQLAVLNRTAKHRRLFNADRLFWTALSRGRILAEYFAYYHGSRTHLSLAKDAPELREVEPSMTGRVRSLAMVGGLHHRYTRKAA